MPYDRHVIVDLPHGVVIDLDIWKAVQSTVAKVAAVKTKNTNIKRIYPLSGGLLKYIDGSPFHGTGAWGRDGRWNYYNNEKHKIRIRVEIIEGEAMRVVTDIIKKTPRLQTAIKKFGKDLQDSVSSLGLEANRIESEIALLRHAREQLDKRLDFLISSDLVGASEFKAEYQNRIAEIRVDTQRREAQLEAIGMHRQQLLARSFNWSEVERRADEIQALMAQENPLILKTAYRSIFKAVVVGELQSQGTRTITFVLDDGDQSESVIKEESIPATGKEWGE